MAPPCNAKQETQSFSIKSAARENRIRSTKTTQWKHCLPLISFSALVLFRLGFWKFWHGAKSSDFSGALSPEPGYKNPESYVSRRRLIVEDRPRWSGRFLGDKCGSLANVWSANSLFVWEWCSWSRIRTVTVETKEQSSSLRNENLSWILVSAINFWTLPLHCLNLSCEELLKIYCLIDIVSFYCNCCVFTSLHFGFSFLTVLWTVIFN